MGAGRYYDGFGAKVDSIGIRDMHPSVNVKQRGPLAVNGDFDLFRVFGGVQRRPTAAKECAGRLVVERHTKGKGAVCWKRVENRHAAAGSVGRTLDLLSL